MTAERGFGGGVFYGIVIAVLVALVGAAVGYMFVTKSGALSRTSSLDSVVVVFAGHGEDGAELAQVTAVITDSGRTVRILDPEQRVTIPGTSYDKLRDAYAFGGAPAVLKVVPKGAGPAWVEVSEKAWVSLLGGSSLQVTLPRPIEVFDGSRLVSVPASTSLVAAADVPLLMQGVSYLATADRMAVVDAVGMASLRALGAAKAASPGVRTNLTPEAYATLMAALAGR